MKSIANTFIRWVSTLSLIAACTLIQAETVHISHCMGACPVSSTGSADSDLNEIVVRHLYASAINKTSGEARWLAYRVLPDSVGVASLLPRRWLLDRLMSASSQMDAELQGGIQVLEPEFENPEESSYLTSEILLDSDDRGRLAPMTSFAGTPYWDELNYLSNMAPLPEFLRMGSWSRLDMAVNEYAQRGAEIYVLSGPIMAAESNGELNQQPDAYFKIISDKKGVKAYIFDSDIRQHAHYCEQSVSLQEVQDRSSLVFFPDMDIPLLESLDEELGCAQH